jgi:3-oxoacyl-(acyl-carrier-protein) synthase
MSEVWITGIGLVTSLAEGAEANWRALAAGAPPVLDEAVNCGAVPADDAAADAVCKDDLRAAFLEVADLDAAWALLDMDGDGVLTKDEFTTALGLMVGAWGVCQSSLVAHRGVSAHPERAEVRRDVDRRRGGSGADLREVFFRAAAGDQQTPVQRGVEFAQAVAEELQTAGSGVGPQTGIQHEAGQHIGAVGGFQQGRQVAQAKVAAKPQNGGGHLPMLPGAGVWSVAGRRCHRAWLSPVR